MDSPDRVRPLVDLLRERCGPVREPTELPLGAQTVAAVLDDLLGAGRLDGALPRTARAGDYVGLRLQACVHRLVLHGRAPDLAGHVPTVGGTSPLDRTDPAEAVHAFRRAVVDALVDHPAELAEALATVPQTNDPRRAAYLRLGLSELPDRHPVRLFEIGAAAGINLRPDRLPGLPAETAGLPAIAERRGCDRAPIDPSTHAGRLDVLSYVWIDDVAGFSRLDDAIDRVADVPAEVVTADAVDFASGVTAMAGTTTLVWHSALRSYLTRRHWSRLMAAIAAAAATSRPDAPLVHLAWEVDPGDAEYVLLTARRWAGVRRPDSRVLVRVRARAALDAVPWPPRSTGPVP